MEEIFKYSTIWILTMGSIVNANIASEKDKVEITISYLLYEQSVCFEIIVDRGEWEEVGGEVCVVEDSVGHLVFLGFNVKVYPS